MIIRQDFQELPPRLFLEQILDKTAKIYCFLWDKKDVKNRFGIAWKDLSKQYNRNAFKTSIRKLNEVGLLSYDETNEGIIIELVGWSEVDEKI